MTRTVLKGEASPEVKEIYEAVRLAQAEGLKAIRAGVSGKEVHSRVSQVFLDQGYPEREGCGFTHSTGHGVGLDVHEKPVLSEMGEVLQVNHVVTVEPGLYYPEIGGVRLEDLVVVKENGCKNLTNFERAARALGVINGSGNFREVQEGRANPGRGAGRGKAAG